MLLTPWFVLIAQVAATPDPVMTYGPWAVLTSAVGILWKLHLDGTARERATSAEALDRERANTAEWKAVAIASQNGLARLTKLIEDKLDIKVPPA